MPIFIPSDTARALRSDFSGCESRALFKDKLNLFDHSFDEDKLVSLDLFLNEGRSDIKRLRSEWNTTKDKQERNQLEGKNVNQRDLSKAEAGLKATEHFENTQKATPNAVTYRRHWIANLPNDQVFRFSLRTASRLLVGLANGTLENAGCSLHPRFGFPIIPGSALKGAARDAARAIDMAPSSCRRIFGGDPGDDDSLKGEVCFMDAFSVLKPTQKDLEADILTPHYQQYYGRNGNENALDEESPIPSIFPAVCAGVEFEFALMIVNPRLNSSEKKEMLEEAAKALKHALLHQGVGAKTSAGYGYFSEIKEPVFKPAMDLFPPPPKPQLSPEEEFTAKWKGQTGNTFKLKALIADLKAIESTEVLQTIFDSVMPVEHISNFRSANPYWGAFLREGGKIILEKLSRPLPRQ